VGDNAPQAILSLVDGPRDIRFEMTARATGREKALGETREMTERNRDKVLRYRGEEGRRAFEAKADEFAVGPIRVELVVVEN
jgi:large subunit ribosomal protein L17